MILEHFSQIVVLKQMKVLLKLLENMVKLNLKIKDIKFITLEHSFIGRTIPQQLKQLSNSIHTPNFAPYPDGFS